ncbi:MAG: lipoic acid synthetase [Candidatus Latescibacterota bacterium]|jgi:lipoic acid synthetase
MSNELKTRRRLPSWLKAKAPGSTNYIDIKNLVGHKRLHTVCESARCPNIGECWDNRTATFMILGDICTRSCGFCAIKTGRPEWLDEGEPERVAEAVAYLDLRHAVITSVNRDELEDGGASIFARTIEELHRLCPQTSIEVLIPDFQGNWDALAAVLKAGPDILNHNIETVPRLYYKMRPQAKYERSLELLERARQLNPAPTKSGMMLGAGENEDEIAQTIDDLADVGCAILTIGQYLSPSADHVQVERYVDPKEFDHWRLYAQKRNFRHVESGPLVRSSYHAEKQVDEATLRAERIPDDLLRIDPIPVEKE